MDNRDQSILVDEEFCDKNLFSHYQKRRTENAKQNPKIHLQDYQLNTINRLHIGYIDHPHIKSTQNISINKHQLKKCNLQKPVCQELEKTKEPLNRNSTVLDLKSKNMFFQRHSGLGKLKPIVQKQLLVNPISQTSRLTIKKNTETPAIEVSNSNYIEQKPASFRYNDLQLSQYLEEFKLLKQETLTNVILPHLSYKSNRTQNNHTQTTNRQQTNNQYYNSILQQNKVKQRQTHIESQKQNLTLSGWSDYSNK
ncbi:unnamed protein product (macronuclear) [Paramecium tetraurelia]|uniref:Uncharacterized protein n=1 Tax=Paramecium tetraurelia TaxID=5888 RepID=A0DS95_PARTE|nr:uncharacterized protein GSPATT00019616001 [Paramecium tetraurelia]CAK85912.1 unnamed protein product [Paramecium tetraurelia]|eukprot:XP_001453309.1 hypothetical protein (macronuclear) [Paramecium tetraurelia strain d4-2]